MEDSKKTSLKQAIVDLVDSTALQCGAENKIVLGKNIVNDKNVLTTSMVSAANTLYVLQDDYDLDGGTVVLGNRSTILFAGGSVNNGTLDYKNGGIIPINKSVFGDHLRVWTDEPVNIALYGAESGDNIDNIIDLLQGHTIIIPIGDFVCTKSGYVLAPNTMFIGEKVLNNDQSCCLSFYPSNEAKPFLIGLNNNCGFKDITLWLHSTTYSGDLVRVDSVFWKNLSEVELQVLRAQQYYIDNVYFYTSWMDGDNYLATAFHVILRDRDDNNQPLASYLQFLAYRQHFKNVEIKYFSIGIRIELKNYMTHAIYEGVWGNSLHFFDIDMWVRNNGFVLETTNLSSFAVGRFLISGILLQPVGTPSSHYPYAFYANNGYDCMLDKINSWNNSKVAYVGGGSIMLGQYASDNVSPLVVANNGKIKRIPWQQYPV